MAARRTLRTLALLAVAMVLTTAACTSNPDPGPTAPVTIPPPEQTHRDLPAPADPLPLSDAAAWSGVGQLRLAGQCTATLLDTGVPAGPAYVLTNGHCAGGWGSHPGYVLVDGDAEDAGSVAFGLVAGAAPGPVLDVVAVPYATMSRYDLAVVQLAGTLADAQGQGLRALPLVTSAPRTGDQVVNVGVPVRELAEQDWVLRTGTCTLGEPVDLLESEWCCGRGHQHHDVRRVRAWRPVRDQQPVRGPRRRCRGRAGPQLRGADRGCGVLLRGRRRVRPRGGLPAAAPA
ncbi:trypsin-like peptidase domain-containing protein [Cellulomonas soli]|uniref:Peptidase S1 domain-containing protein n=1 Tax=Cellulomonas soli TaxID=931535 RepID=A0A512PBH6_9CELL|nr:trypsin-like peptidase domain-containing protein [Cellulomonas soli]NYI61029.1 hypothetical protein [Cellulomonas soli]GEP68555.1 hypothetical protein CSO01_12700 [Cellulomonas soli]